MALHACRLQTHSARRVSDLDKSVTELYQGRLTVAARFVEFVFTNRDVGADNGRYDRIVYDRRTERCKHEFQALQPLSLLSHGSRG